MGDFFAEKKKQLKLSGLLNDERIAALDKRILSCVHSLLRQGLEADAHRLFAMVNWDLMKNKVIQSRVVCLVVTGFRFRRSESIYCREPRARTWQSDIDYHPFLNAEAWLAEAVESALGQTGLDSEIVCVITFDRRFSGRGTPLRAGGARDRLSERRGFGCAKQGYSRGLRGMARISRCRRSAPERDAWAAPQ